MKKTSLNNFDGKLISKNEAFAIQSEDYLSKLVANKVYVSPLQNVRGNIESSTSQENIIIINIYLVIHVFEILAYSVIIEIVSKIDGLMPKQDRFIFFRRFAVIILA